MAKYDVDYFIAKFKAIPASKWCISAYGRDDKHCALGHCGVKSDGFLTSVTSEAAQLECLVPNIVCVNDGDERFERSPRSRVLAALRELKKRSKSNG